MKKIQLSKIVDDSLKRAGLLNVIRDDSRKEEKKSVEVAPAINEAVIAQPKTYQQVSESISQKAKDAHKRLYQKYVELFNKTSAEIDSASRDADQAQTYRELKLCETNTLNAIWLHELFFANCFNPQSEIYADSMSYMKLQRDFGSFEDWQRHFIASSLAAGEGWVVCGYNVFLRKYVNCIVSGHDQNVMLGLYPIFVLDMWSHSYYKDFIDDKQSYVIAMMREINWPVVEERVKKAEQMAEILK